MTLTVPDGTLELVQEIQHVLTGKDLDIVLCALVNLLSIGLQHNCDTIEEAREYATKVAQALHQAIEIYFATGLEH